VNWYSDRGEGYEANLVAVDGHLRHLALAGQTGAVKGSGGEGDEEFGFNEGGRRDEEYEGF